MAISTTILIDGNLSSGGFLTPIGSSVPPYSTTDGNDLVTLTSLGGTGLVDDWLVSTVAGDDIVNINGSLSRSVISLGEGADEFNINRYGLGGSINTSLIAGNAGNDTLNLLVGGNGAANSTFRGGSGDDLINLDGNFTGVLVVGGQGDDQIRFLAPGLFTGSTAQGGQGSDIIQDDGFAVDFSGSTLRGGADNDIINVSKSFSGLGADGLFIAGGIGNDSLYGTLTGQNTIGGGQNDDFIQAFDGDDLLRGGDGNDTIISGFGNDTVLADNDGQAGADVIFGISGSNKIIAGGGDDFVAGGVSDDSVDGGAGFDTLIGGAGDDTINGGDNADIIFGSDIDEQTGIGFNAFVTAGPSTVGADVRAQYTTNATAANALSVDNPVISIANYQLAATVAFPNPYRNYLTGGNGHDFIFGGNGVDEILGGSGNDTITGGVGSDIMSGGGASGSDVFVQGSLASVQAAASTQTTNWTINWATVDAAPDIITDFVANAGTTVVDRVAFSDPGGAFTSANAATFAVRNATNSADFAGWGVGEVVVFAGNWDANNGQFDTANRSSGTANDILAFVATSASGSLSTDMGDQAVVLLGAANQSFVGANFFGTIV